MPKIFTISARWRFFLEGQRYRKMERDSERWRETAKDGERQRKMDKDRER